MNKNNFLSLTFVAIMIELTFFNKSQFLSSPNNSIGQVSVKDILSDEKSVDRKRQLLAFSDLNTAGISDLNLEVQKIEGIVEKEIYQHLEEKKKEKEEEIKKELPEMAVQSALVFNLTADKEIASYNPNLVWPLASLSKLMTAIVAVEEMGHDRLITITEQAVENDGPAGDFKAGEIFAVRDILKSLFLVSSNDGAFALAENYSKENFIGKMNEKGFNLKMESTFFEEPAGLSEKNVSTVEDLKNMMQYIYKERPELLFLSKQKEAEIVDFKTGESKKYESINEFAGQEGFLGGKTGYTDKARGNLISIFMKNNQAILIIVLGTEDRFEETKKLLEWVKI